MSTDDATPQGAEGRGPERRRFPRLARSCSIRVRPLDGLVPDRDGFEARTVNISGGGVCFESATRLAVGSFSAVELRLPEFDSQVLALARTVFSAESGPPHETGLEFWWVGWSDDSAQRAIADMIRTELRQQGTG